MLTNDQQAGICMRGSADAPNAFPAQMMMLSYLPYSPSNKGIFLDSAWQPTLSSPGGHAFAEDYAKLMHQYAPQGVGAYGFTDCQQAFAEGKVAMWYDDSAISARLYNTALYPLAANLAPVLGFDELPCPPSNPNACLLFAPWYRQLHHACNRLHHSAVHRIQQSWTVEQLSGTGVGL